MLRPLRPDGTIVITADEIVRHAQDHVEGRGRTVRRRRRHGRPVSAEHLDPARSVIDCLGGVVAVASITGRDTSRVLRWMYPRAKGGSAGLIPNRVARRLLAYAAGQGIALGRGAGTYARSIVANSRFFVVASG